MRRPEFDFGHSCKHTIGRGTYDASGLVDLAALAASVWGEGNGRCEPGAPASRESADHVVERLR